MERERESGRRGSWQVYRCIISATQWCREKRIATPTQEKLEGELILTNWMSFCLYCYTFFFLPFHHFLVLKYLYLFFSIVCFPLSSLLPISYRAPQSFNTLALPFLAACSLFFLHVATSVANVSCAVSCTVATNQAPHSSRVICAAESWICALSPLLCLHWQPPLHFIIAQQIRSDRNWAKKLSAG